MTMALEANCVRVLLVLMAALAVTAVGAAAAGRQDVSLVLGLFEADVVWIGALTVSVLLHRRGVPMLDGWRNVVQTVTPAPVRRVVVAEVDSLVSLTRVSLRRPPRIPVGAEGFPSRDGTLAIPIAFAVVTLVEVAVLHLVLPSPTLSAILTLISVYGLILLLGVIASRWDHPHYATSTSLVLRNGAHVVADIPYRDISYVVPVRDGSVVAPTIDDGIARLATMNGCNVAVRLASLHPMTLSGYRPGREQSVHEIRFAADDAAELIRTLEARRR